MSDFIKDAITKFMADGMTPLEAFREFEKEKIKDAVRQALDDDGLESPLFKLFVRSIREEANESAMEQALELWLAGWTSETPSKSQTEVWQWYWRAPPKGKRPLGRRYVSTTQAFNAMKKAAK